MAEPEYPIPNLAALKAQLPPGLALELVEALTGAETTAEVPQILADRLRARASEIEEGLRATPEVD